LQDVARTQDEFFAGNEIAGIAAASDNAANRFAHHLLGNLQSEINVFHFGVTIDDICRIFASQPVPTARRALATRFVMIEVHDDLKQIDHAIAVIDHYDRAGSEHGAHLRETFVIHRRFHRFLGI